jgi:hypothetical protein
MTTILIFRNPLFQKDASCRLSWWFLGLGYLELRRLLLFLFPFPLSELENLQFLPLLGPNLFHMGDQQFMQTVSPLQYEGHQRSNREVNSH